MKYIILFIFFCLGNLLVANTQPKVVYMSIDVSGSMKGNKYNLANYTVQMITGLMDDNDELYLSVGGQYRKIDITGNKREIEITNLQKPFNTLGINYLKTEIADIKAFNQTFKNQPEKDQWFFIVGDGYWKTEVTCDEFKKIISENPVKVYFLETMESIGEHGLFGECLDDLSFVTQYRSSNDPQTIIENCIRVATSLFGISDESATVTHSSGNCYSLTNLLPINKLYIVYQNEAGSADLPSLAQVTYDGKNIPISRQMSVSTEKMNIKGKSGKLLSGRIAVISPLSPLPANKKIELCFNKSIDLSKLKIYPQTEVKSGPGTSILVNVGTPRTDASGNETTICIENDSAIISYEVVDSEGNPLPQSLLSKTKVKVKTNDGEGFATLKKGIFEYSVPLKNKTELYYNMEIECPGYFKIISGKKKITKSIDCDRPLSEIAPAMLMSIRAEDLAKDKCIEVFIVDENDHNVIFNPNNFDLEVKRDYQHLFKKVEIKDVTDKSFFFCFQAYGMWCECFLPDTLSLTIYATPKDGSLTQIEQPVKFYIDKSGKNWVQRCQWVLLTMSGLLLFILYLIGLNKKKRFKKGSMVRYQYFGVGGIKSRQNTDDMRSKGFFNWINRWWIPFSPERTSKSFAKAGNKTFSFTATNSAHRVEIPKTQYNSKDMSSLDYNREQFERKNIKTFSMSHGTNIKITLPQGTGSFEFCYDKAPGIKDDVPAFKVFIAFLIILAVLTEIFFGYFLIAS